jgi:flavin-dependent dehydrogenase
VQPVGPNAVNACAMVRVDAARSLPEVFARHPELHARSRDWESLFAPITTSSLYFHEPQTEHRGMLMAGDAAGFVDPFAGDGISLALHTGSLAAQSLHPFLQGNRTLGQVHRDYRDSYRKRFAPVFRNAARIRRALSTPSMVRRMLLSLAATRLIAGIVVRNTRVQPS